MHKAALNGHLQVVTYLLPHKADVHARDADGWTALHNACSKVLQHISSSVEICGSYYQGYLDIVRWLCETGGAASGLDGIRGVDIRSKGGWTPLSECTY